MFRVSPFALPLIALAGVVALVFSLRAFAAHHHDLGHAAGYALRSGEMEAALEVAQGKIDRLAALAAEQARRVTDAEAHTATLLEDLADEAARDPDGIRLSADSVRRLNAIAGGAGDPGAP